MAATRSTAGPTKRADRAGSALSLPQRTPFSLRALLTEFAQCPLLGGIGLFQDGFDARPSGDQVAGLPLEDRQSGIGEGHERRPVGGVLDDSQVVVEERVV